MAAAEILGELFLGQTRDGFEDLAVRPVVVSIKFLPPSHGRFRAVLVFDCKDKPASSRSEEMGRE